MSNEGKWIPRVIEGGVDRNSKGLSLAMEKISIILEPFEDILTIDYTQD